MVLLELAPLLAVGLPTIGAVVWLVRLEGRINVHESQLGSLRDDVRYIRDRIDEALRCSA